jgi:hypothetical protein
MTQTATQTQPKYKMPVKRAGTFGPPLEPAYRVYVRVIKTDTIVGYSAHSEQEAARIAASYKNDYATKIVPRGTPAESLEWTQ